MYQERLKITIYCSFDFGDFPFDSHQCDLNIGVSNYFPDQVTLSPLNISYKDQNTSFGEKGISVELTNTPEPFEISLTSMDQFELHENEHSFSFTG